MGECEIGWAGVVAAGGPKGRDAEEGWCSLEVGGQEQLAVGCLEAGGSSWHRWQVLEVAAAGGEAWR